MPHKRMSVWTHRRGALSNAARRPCRSNALASQARVPHMGRIIFAPLVFVASTGLRPCSFVDLELLCLVCFVVVLSCFVFMGPLDCRLKSPGDRVGRYAFQLFHGSMQIKLSLNVRNTCQNLFLSTNICKRRLTDEHAT